MVEARADRDDHGRLRVGGQVARTQDVGVELGPVGLGDRRLRPGRPRRRRSGRRGADEGDRISRDAIASLFESGIDPLVVIRWKDIFERLEDAIDACEHVANTLEGIVIKNS
jgi:hypothetical protein